MALSKAKVREILSKAGVDAEHMSEALTEILDGNTASLEAIKEERDRYKEDAQRYEAAKKELETLQKSGEKSPYKVKYEALVEEHEALQKEYEGYKESVTAEKTAAQKREAYRRLLQDVGISEKRIDAVLKVSDFETLHLGKDGKFQNADTLKEAIKTEWADFITVKSEKGASVANPPASTGGSTMTREEIMKIADTHDRQRAWEEFLENERKK